MAPSPRILNRLGRTHGTDGVVPGIAADRGFGI